MKIVDSWLRELASIPEDRDAIAFALSDLGLAVESVDEVGSTVPGVVTARVLRTERHPDAGKVHRVFVETGDGVERHVWCGAFNMSAGDIVPLATPGTKMPDGRSIEPKPILGIQSDGMLCSAAELGLGIDHSGILIFPADTLVGIAYGEALGQQAEWVYDLDVLRNRPDAFCHRGVARDLAARFKISDQPFPASIVFDEKPLSASVEIVDEHRCPRFSAVVLSGIEVGESPDWMKSRLSAAGMRPINNVVDVSNYVMLETGQPNHPYDFETLAGGGFRIRSARPEERLITLDGVERTLDVDDLLICDATDRPIGLAGVMGGENTEISRTTTMVALETAWFEPVGIMRTVQRHHLRTEASARFERGVDPFGVEMSVRRFVDLLRLTCPDVTVHAGMVDVQTAFLPQPTVISVRPQRVSQLLGVPFTAGDIATLIEPIGFLCAVGTANEDAETVQALEVTVPSWRPDCTLEIDIVEEVARHYGYGNVGRTIPKSTLPGGLTPAQQRRRLVREILLGLGIHEAMPHPFLTDGDLSNAGLPDVAVRLVNPLALGDDVLRTSVRPGLLKALAFNETHRRSGLSFFEIGHVYPPSEEVLPAEFEQLGVVLAGRDAAHAVHVWRELAAALGWGARLDQANVPDGLHPTRSATLSAGKSVIGAIGEVHPDVLDAFGISERVAVLELNLGVLLEIQPRIPQWKPVSRFPSSDFDLAFRVPMAVTAEKVEKALRQGSGSLLVDLVLFDVYRNADLPDERSLAFRLRLQAPDRTLTDTDVTAVREKCLAAAAKLGATLRT